MLLFQIYEQIRQLIRYGPHSAYLLLLATEVNTQTSALELVEDSQQQIARYCLEPRPRLGLAKKSWRGQI